MPRLWNTTTFPADVVVPHGRPKSKRMRRDMNSSDSGYDELFSVRMRASLTKEGTEQHISGAERIAVPSDVAAVVGAMVARALSHPLGRPDQVKVAIDRLASVVKAAALPVITVEAGSDGAGRSFAVEALSAAGVPAEIAHRCVEDILEGSGPGRANMRGAMVVCVESGRRLEFDRARGVRASRMDVSAQLREHLRANLPTVGAKGDRTLEALCVASKITSYAGVVAEYCCSDDPDYTGGYVASRRHGYIRIDALKRLGHRKGGRTIFVKRPNLPELMEAIERSVLIFDSFGGLSSVFDLAAARQHLQQPSLTKFASAFTD